MAKATVRTTVIKLNQAAPAKPAPGEACNGCGVCCSCERCPLGMLLFQHRHGRCEALIWQEQQRRYACGLLLRPVRYIPWVPVRYQPLLRRWIARSIAAGRGCDAAVSVEPT